MQERAGGRTGGGLGAFASLLGVASLSAAADLLSKWWVFSWWEARGFRIGSRPCDLIPGYLSVFATLNTGGVFSIGQGMTGFFVLFSIITIGVIFWIWYGYGRFHPLLTMALGLVLGGAIGNLWDRVYYGAVRDFIDFHVHEKFQWPAFNIADAFICIGAGLLLVYALRHPATEKNRDSPHLLRK